MAVSVLSTVPSTDTRCPPPAELLPFPTRGGPAAGPCPWDLPGGLGQAPPSPLPQFRMSPSLGWEWGRGNVRRLTPASHHSGVMTPGS